jgi:hypothetical protein
LSAIYRPSPVRSGRSDAERGTNPNDDIYSYPGSGAVNATYELATPISVTA